MNSKYPYLDPDWIPIMTGWVQQTRYDPSLTNEALARDLAYTAGKNELILKLEQIVKLQEKTNVTK